MILKMIDSLIFRVSVSLRKTPTYAVHTSYLNYFTKILKKLNMQTTHCIFSTFNTQKFYQRTKNAEY